MYFDKLAAYDLALTEAVLEKIAEEQGMSPEEAAAALAAAAQQGEEEEKQVEAMLEMAKEAMVRDFRRVMEKVAIRGAEMSVVETVPSMVEKATGKSVKEMVDALGDYLIANKPEQYQRAAKLWKNVMQKLETRPYRAAEWVLQHPRGAAAGAAGALAAALGLGGLVGHRIGSRKKAADYLAEAMEL